MPHPGAGNIAAENVHCRCVLKATGRKVLEAVTPPTPPEPPAQMPDDPEITGGPKWPDDGRAPSGKNVSDFADVAAPIRRNVTPAFDAIERVHGIDHLPKIPVVSKRSMRGGAVGGTAIIQSGVTGEILSVQEIRLLYGADRQSFTFVHEVGHWIDIGGFTKGLAEQSMLSGTPVRDVVEIARQSPEIHAIESLLKRKTITITLDGVERTIPTPKRYLEYLLSPNEIWARSYSQYIAHKSNSEVLLADLKQERQEIAGSQDPIPKQWEEANFLPIFTAIEKLLADMGWRK